MIYRVGIATDPQPEDRIYDCEQQAIEKAQDMVDAYGVKTPIAVWDEQDDPVWLFLLGEQFRKV